MRAPWCLISFGLTVLDQSLMAIPCRFLILSGSLLIAVTQFQHAREEKEGKHGEKTISPFFLLFQASAEDGERYRNLPPMRRPLGQRGDKFLELFSLSFHFVPFHYVVAR